MQTNEILNCDFQSGHLMQSVEVGTVYFTDVPSDTKLRKFFWLTNFKRNSIRIALDNIG